MTSTHLVTPGDSPAPRVLTVRTSGDPRTRGRAYGEQARQAVHGFIGLNEGLVARTGARWHDLHGWCDRLVEVIDAVAPDLVEEMQGIADGAGVGLADILIVNARAELLAAAGRPTTVTEDGCTAFASLPHPGSGEAVWCGQNRDWVRGGTEHLVVLDVQAPGQPRILTVVGAGQVALHGFNDAGLGLNATSLPGPPTGQLGIPQTVLRRRLLASSSLREAMGTALSCTSQVPSRLLLTHRDGLSVAMSTSGPQRHTQVVVQGVAVIANGDPSTVVNGDDEYAVDSLYRAPLLAAAIAHPAGGDPARRTQLERGLAGHAGHPYSICRHPAGGPADADSSRTICSMITDLTAATTWLSVGYSCEGAYQPYALPMAEDANSSGTEGDRVPDKQVQGK